LTLLAAQLTANVRRKSDLVARYGGEEFAVILPESSETAALAIAESMRLAIESLALQQPASQVTPYLTISAGVVTAEGWTSPEELIAAADQALYSAKRSGRNRVVVAPFVGIHQNEDDPAPVNPS
jgi:diguanylate cyclase (GGDEF)-like protein